jgi:hypothetical protein
MVSGAILHTHDHRWCIAPALPALHRSRSPSHNARPRRHSKSLGNTWPLSLFAALLLAFATTATAHAEDPAYELFIERSPADAGQVIPNTGTHRFSPNSTVTLTANPQPGYRFAYWLGDVSDPRAQRTTIVLTEPKVVVAVFSRDPRKRVDDQISLGSGGGSGATVATATDLSAPGWSPSGGARADGTSRTLPILVPVIVTPEPTTIALLGLGVIVLRRRPR